MSSELSDFFKLLAEEKQKKKEEIDSIVGNLELDSLFNEVANLKKENKKKKIKEKNTIQAFEKWLYSDTPIKQKKIIEDVIEDSLEEVLEVLEDHKEELEEPKEELIEKSLGLLAEPSDVKQQNDPLTPLDQKFATLDDLQKHYNLFLSRIQQQLSTLGGGGEYRFRFLDGIVGIKTNSTVYDGKFLQWNSTTNKAEFVNPNAVGVTSIVSISGVTTYYQATNNDDYIGVSANNPVTIALPTSPVSGKKITVKDEGNKIATYNITVTVGAGVSVENDTSVIMTINHQSFTYFFNGNNWFLI